MQWARISFSVRLDLSFLKWVSFEGKVSSIYEVQLMDHAFVS